MKPIWIVDDDQSIRFVLEKALAREELAVRSFSSGRDVMAALRSAADSVGSKVTVKLVTAASPAVAKSAVAQKTK